MKRKFPRGGGFAPWADSSEPRVPKAQAAEPPSSEIPHEGTNQYLRVVLQCKNMPPSPSSPKNTARWKRRGFQYVTSMILLCGASFVAGWTVNGVLSAPGKPQPLRLGGYQFISPLLACNFTALKILPESQRLSNDIQAIIDKHKNAGDVSKASTYFIDLATNAWSDTYETQKYYPSSITKIPIMMAYFELAGSSSSILDQKITYRGGEDLNGGQETKPAVPLVPGQAYTVEELIEHMIKYSDNDAAGLLYDAIDQNTLRNIYNDLGIPINPDPTAANLDFMTPQQIAILFRILYNATYLSRDASEHALQLLSTTDFKQGLAAGVPSSTIMSHKFGIVGITQNSIETERELHDCGIVYAPNHPYLLCVMTRSSALPPLSLETAEGVIAQISETVYNDVENGKE